MVGAACVLAVLTFAATEVVHQQRRIADALTRIAVQLEQQVH